MTFSLVARDPRSGAFGMVICSSSPAVAARCVHLRPGVGAAGSQNITDPRLGQRALDLLAEGRTARQAVDDIVAQTPAIGYRQLILVDGHGRTAAFSGPHTLGVHAVAHGAAAVAAGNLLRHERVVETMLGAYAGSRVDGFEDRLLHGLRAALAAGGEAGPVRSAGLCVVDTVAWPVTDLRVDWDDDPVGKLRQLWDVWRAQKEHYRARGLDPSGAPSFAVPGDP